MHACAFGSQGQPQWLLLKCLPFLAWHFTIRLEWLVTEMQAYFPFCHDHPWDDEHAPPHLTFHMDSGNQTQLRFPVPNLSIILCVYGGLNLLNFKEHYFSAYMINYNFLTGSHFLIPEIFKTKSSRLRFLK